MTPREKAIMGKITAAFFGLLGIILVLVFRLNDASVPSVVACAVIVFAAGIYAGREDQKAFIEQWVEIEEDHGPAPDTEGAEDQKGPPPGDQ